MNEREALEFVQGIESIGIVPGLDSIIELCRELGDPQKTLKVVQVAGTNGKGSTTAFISNILRAAGYRVGTYVSPTIFEYRERIQVNGRMISRRGLGENMALVKAACERMTGRGLPHPSPFEVETALAFLYFAEKKCDIVVLECGMGGRLDATNLIEDTLVSVIASVGMDHMQFLGDTLEKIAGEKAGIIKKDSHVVCMAQDEKVLNVVRGKAAEMNAVFHLADAALASHLSSNLERQRFDYAGMKGLTVHLLGRFQISNAVLAIEAVKALTQADETFRVSEDALKAGLEGTVWKGRFTLIDKKPLFFVDGAHNEDAARKLAATIEFYFTNKRIIFIMGVLRDKEYDRIIDLTCGYAAQIITITPPQNKRALQALALAEAVRRVNPNVTTADSLEEAVEMARMLAGRDDVILAFGSLSYLGQLMRLVEKQGK